MPTLCTAELFDGNSTAPQNGILRLSNESVTLTGPDGSSYQWRLSEIDSLENTAAGYCCVLRQRSPSGYQLQLFFTDDTVYRKLKNLVHQRKSCVVRFFQKVWALKLWQVTLLILLTLICFFYLFFYLLHRAYTITPVAYDTHLGSKIDSSLAKMYERCESPAIDTFLTKAMRQLSRPEDRFTHRVIVLNDPTRNAISIPGGTIYLFRGLLDSSRGPDEILGVLSHEISHAEERHSVRQILQSLGLFYMGSLFIGIAMEGFDFLEGLEQTLEMSSVFFTLRYSRQFEREADSLGIFRLHRANLRVGPLDSLLTRITPPPKGRDRIFNLLSTHPMQKERSERFTKARLGETFPPDTVFSVERENWDAIKKCCSDSIPQKPLWKKLITKRGKRKPDSD